MNVAIDHEELAWAQECLAAGDSLNDLAEASGRTVAEWVRAFPQAVVEPVANAVDPMDIRDGLFAPFCKRTKLAWTAAYAGLFPQVQPGWKRPEFIHVTVFAAASRWQARFVDPASVISLTTRLAHLRNGSFVIAEQTQKQSFYIRSEAGR